MLTGLVFIFGLFFFCFVPNDVRASKKKNIQFDRHNFTSPFQPTFTLLSKESVIFQIFSNQVDGIHQMKYKPSGLDLKSIAADLFTPIYKLNLLK